jgi:membrane-bound serine protease (ClpP class)
MRRIALFAAFILSISTVSAQVESIVVVLDIKGGIGVATADYVLSGIEYAHTSSADIIIIEMDTPGGLMAPMRDIIQAILGSSIPVITYVTPAGARADSAGTYILLASHIAAMSPTTHLGAATPVSLGGDGGAPESSDDEKSADDVEAGRPPASTMERKVLNDAVAYIRSLAERFDRNADWAEKAVRDAATLTARQALEQNVVDIVAENRAELLRLVDGIEVKVDSGLVTLATDTVVIEEYEPSWRIKVLSAIANPEIVLLLGLIGLYGLMYEGWNPGAIVPGVVGVICLLLAAYALQVLPVNYAGLALIIVGLALMTAEAFAPSFGALGLGGIVAFVFGAIMMFDSGIPGFGISIAFVVALAAGFALLFIWLFSYLLKLRRRGAVSGKDSIIGGFGTAMQAFSGEGRVWLEGETWVARSDVAVEKDQQVVVRALDGLVLKVEPVGEPHASDAPHVKVN